jgi:hypothetical protein
MENRETNSVSEKWVTGIVGMYCRFLTRILYVCWITVWGVAVGFWVETLCNLGIHWLFCAVSSFTCHRSWMQMVCKALRKCWSGLDELTRMVVAYTTQTLWKAESPSPETMPRIKCICKWIFWKQRIQPRITVQETLWGDFSASPETNFLQWFSVPARGTQHTQSSVSASGLVQTWVKGCSPLCVQLAIHLPICPEEPCRFASCKNLWSLWI